MQNTSYSGDFSEWYDAIDIADSCIKYPYEEGEVNNWTCGAGLPAGIKPQNCHDMRFLKIINLCVESQVSCFTSAYSR